MQIQDERVPGPLALGIKIQQGTGSTTPCDWDKIHLRISLTCAALCVQLWMGPCTYATNALVIHNFKESSSGLPKPPPLCTIPGQAAKAA